MLIKNLDTTMVQFFGSKMPSISYLEKRAALGFINSNPIIDRLGPLPERVVAVGGMHIKESKSLPTVTLNSIDKMYMKRLIKL